MVYGHVERGLLSSHILAGNRAVVGVDRFVYAFHMALFFVVSGFFLAPADDLHEVVGVATKLRRIWYPYLIWAPLQTGLQIVAGSHINHRVGVDALARILYDPPMQFWFLYALFVQNLIFWTAWRFGVGRTRFFVLAVALATLGHYDHHLGSFSPLYPALSNLPYLAAGVWLGKPNRFAMLSAMPKRTAVAVAVAGFGVVAGFAFAGDQVWAARWPAVLAVSGVCAVFGCGILLRHSRALVYLGKHSLSIFVAHTIASAGARIVLEWVFHVESLVVHLIVGVTVGVLAPLVLVNLGERLNFPYLFAWPSVHAQSRHR